MLRAVPYLYGDRITDADGQELLDRLEARGTQGATMAVVMIKRGHPRDATSADGVDTRQAILLELVEWDDLASTAPSLVVLRDRLASLHEGRGMA
jgi:hypothetical protein